MRGKELLSLIVFSLSAAGCVVPGTDSKEPLPNQLPSHVYLHSIIAYGSNLSAPSLISFNPQRTGSYTIYDDSTGKNLPFNLWIKTELPGDMLTVKRNNNTLGQAGVNGLFLIPRLSRTETSAQLSIRVTRIVKENGKMITISNAYSVSIIRSSPTTAMFGFVKQCFADIASKTTLVIGNPNHNTSAEAKAVAARLSELQLLLKGTESKRQFKKIDQDGITTEQEWENYLFYDIDKILTKLDEIDESAAKLNQTDLYVRIKNHTFPYTGAPDLAQLDPQHTAVYELAAVGASGGHMTSISTKYSSLGGKGGSVKARFSIQKQDPPQLLCVRVGGQGQGTAEYNAVSENYTILKTNYASQKLGGWPNGGPGGAAGSGSDFNSTQTFKVGWAPGTGGGGATDIFFLDMNDTDLMAAAGYIKQGVSGADVYFENIVFSGAESRYIVAAGGGGCAHSPDSPWRISAGGNAGEDGNGFLSQTTPNSPFPFAGESSTDSGWSGIAGALFPPMTGSGGGGGGFKGGGANMLDRLVAFSGAGGVNHIDSSAPITFQSTGTASTYGHGYASITWINDVD